MPKLSEELLKQVRSTQLPRVTDAKTVSEAVAFVVERVEAFILISPEMVLSRAAVEGIVPQGLARATVLTGKEGTGRPHVSVRTNFGFANKAQIEEFCANVAKFKTIQEVQEAYYGFIDAISIPMVIWDNEPSWMHRTSSSTWTGKLRSDSVTGNVSISEAVPEKPTLVIKAKKPTLNASIPVGNAIPTPPAPDAPAPPPAPAPAAPVMKNFNGAVYSVADLLAAKWSQAAIDALPNA